MTEAARSTIQLADSKGVIRHGGEWLVLWSDPDSVKSAVDKAAEQAASVRRAEYERLVAAALRGVAHRPELRVLFRGEPVEITEGQVILPALPAEPGPHDLAVVRGIADGIAVRLRWHDPALHARLAPSEPRRRAIFDLLEQARCEALGAGDMPGLRANLTAASEARLARQGLARAHLAAQIPIVEAMRVIALDVLTGAIEPSIPTNGMEMWDRFVRLHAGVELSALRSALTDQVRFASLAEQAVAALADAMGWDDAARQRRTEPAAGAPAGLTEIAPEGRRVGDARLHGDLARNGLDDAALESVEGAGPDLDDPPLPRSANVAPGAAVSHAQYCPYLTAHDIVIDAASLSDAVELARLRHELDSALGDMRRVLTRLANRLQRRLAAQQMRAWDFDLEEGLLDAARLDRIVTRPGSALSFKQERASPFADTVVALLIDNSGSMRGRAITIAAMVADLTVRALERCGVRSEVLGFTTRSWKGGRPYQAWAAAGRPADPGRLNELCHIVYKAAGTPYRRSRVAFGAMLQPGLLKENIDGEALRWCHSRLLALPEQRKIMVVISDGAPMDQATMQANPDTDCLDRHLREVIAGIVGEARVELLAVGIRHDVGRHYPQAVRIDDAADLGATMLAALERLFAPSGRGAGARPAERPTGPVASR